MGMIDNLSQSQVGEIFRRLRALENASPMNNGAVGRGGFEVYDGGVINVTNGGLNVTGTISVTGTLQADGTIALTGTLTQSGPSTFTGDTKLNGPTHINGATDVTGNLTVTGDTKLNGPTHINGATDIKGTLSVEGAATLKNDLTVTTGKIKAGGMTIDPAADSGSLTFSTGAKLANYSSGIAMQIGSAVLGVTPDGVSMGTSAASVMTNTSIGTTIVTGKLRVSNLPTTTQAANVYVDADGNLFRKV